MRWASPASPFPCHLPACCTALQMGSDKPFQCWRPGCRALLLLSWERGDPLLLRLRLLPLCFDKACEPWERARQTGEQTCMHAGASQGNTGLRTASWALADDTPPVTSSWVYD